MHFPTVMASQNYSQREIQLLDEVGDAMLFGVTLLHFSTIQKEQHRDITSIINTTFEMAGEFPETEGLMHMLKSNVGMVGSRCNDAEKILLQSDEARNMIRVLEKYRPNINSAGEMADMLYHEYPKLMEYNE